MILNLKTSTPNYMIYGELGRYPVEIDIKIIIISFWAKIICGKQSKISCIEWLKQSIKQTLLDQFLQD